MGRIIRADGREEQYVPKNGATFTLEELQGAVGGYIEICRLKDGTTLMIMDEEGKLKDKPVNIKATLLLDIPDIVVGDVLVCDENEVE